MPPSFTSSSRKNRSMTAISRQPKIAPDIKAVRPSPRGADQGEGDNDTNQPARPSRKAPEKPDLF